MKNMLKATGHNFVVPKLEGLWWVEGDRPMLETQRAAWHWQLMLRLPDFVQEQQVQKSVEEAAPGAGGTVGEVTGRQSGADAARGAVRHRTDRHAADGRLHAGKRAAKSGATPRNLPF